MGYLKYITNYYNRKINEYENIQVDKDTIIEAKELVKLMEDLLDEGYHEAYNNIENNFNGITRLKKYIENNNEKCFPIDISADKSNNFINGSYEINEYLNNLQLKNNLSTYKEHPLFMKLNEYCQWIKEKECAYVFLLRDTLLPYLAFQKERINNIYPLYFSRESLDLMTNKANLHGLFSDIIFDALDKEPKDLNELKKLIKEPITNVLNEYPQVKKYLMKFLSEIKEKKINVIESGYNGTFPLVLCILDNRVTFKMFTTAPYLYNIYKGNFFTKDYHLNRLFETFISQDSMFNITRIDENNNIYISENNNSLLRKKGKEEITNWFHFIEEKTMINIKEQLELNTYNFLNNEEKEFIIEYNNKMESLGYTCDNKIVDGICYGKYMMIYRKRDVKSKKVYSRIYFRGRGIVLRLFLSEKDVTKNSSYIDKSPMCIKESFTGDYAKCNHCRGDDCRFKKVYYINDTLYEKCNGLTFEFFNLKKENLQLYIDLFLLFYKSKK